MVKTNYSGTKCPKCEKSIFDLVEDSPNNSNYKYFYLRCSSCKTFLHAFEFLPFAQQIELMNKDLKKIKSHLGIIEGI